MPTYSTSLKLTLIGDGEETGTWGSTTNTNLGTLLEQAIVGQTTITMVNADYTLTNLNGVTDEARNAVIIITGSQNATYNVIVPNVPKLYMVTNSLGSSQIAYIKPSGGSVFQIPNGRTMYLYTNGTTFYALDYVSYAQNLVSGGTITTGAINCTSLTSTGAIAGSTTITAGTQFSGPGTGITGTAAGLSIGGNAATATTVSTTVASGATGTTQTAGTNNTTIATTQFVQAATTALGLGTMSTQNSNNVTITGGSINGVTGTNAGMTVGNATLAATATLATTATTANALNTSNAYQGTTFTATTQFTGPGTGLTGTAASLTAGIASVARNITNSGGWSVTPSGTKLFFNYNGTNVGSLDSSGNFIVIGNVTAYGTP
jgi:hypothetical protein